MFVSDSKMFVTIRVEVSKQMGQKLLSRKLAEQKRPNRGKYIQFLIPIAVYFLYFPLNALLGASQYYINYLTLTVVLGASFLLAAIMWIKYQSNINRYKRWMFPGFLIAASPQIYVAYLIFFEWPFIPSYLTVVIVFELFFYSAHYALGGLPGNRIVFWISILIILGSGGFFFAFSTVASHLSGVSVEIIGAFIGVFAALILSEAIREFDHERETKELKFLILYELSGIEERLQSGGDGQIPIPIWSAALSNGSLLKLDTVFLKKATQAHEKIHYFNADPRVTKSREDALKSIRLLIDEV